MNIKKSAVNTMVLSLLVVLVGLALALGGLGLKMHGGSAHMINFTQLFLCMLAAVVFSFAYGWVRHSLAEGISLMAAVLHDLLLSFGLVAILGVVVPQAASLPLLVMMTVVFTYAQTFPLLQELRNLRNANSVRDMGHEEVARHAVRQTARLRLVGLLIAGLLLVAAGVSGNLRLAGQALALCVGLLVSFYAAQRLTPGIWVMALDVRAKGSARK